MSVWFKKLPIPSILISNLHILTMLITHVVREQIYLSLWNVSTYKAKFKGSITLIKNFV